MYLIKENDNHNKIEVILSDERIFFIDSEGFFSKLFYPRVFKEISLS